jgi:bla regulator protein blaR1
MGAIASHVWQSTVVAAVAAALIWLFRHNRASVRFWICFAASMKFLLPFAALSAAMSVLPWPHWAHAESEAVSAVSVVFRLDGLTVGTSNATVWWIFSVWLTGTFVVLARWAWEWTRVAATVRASEPMNEGSVFDALRRIERAVGITQPTTLVSSRHHVEPGIVGILNPVLIWPKHLSANLPDDHVEPIIVHELMHVMRRDNLLASLHMLVSAAFWFHPAVWWIGRRLIEERERACDEQVLALGQSPATYAAGILKTCELCVSSPLVNVSGVTGGDLKRRIQRIVRNRSGSPLGLAKKATLVFVALVIFLAPIAAGVSLAMPQQVEEQPRAAQKDDPDQPVRPGGRVIPPRVKKEVKPQYSERAKQQKIEGEVLMECVVKADGTVGDIKVVKSLDPDLDQAAIDAAKLWEFEPGTRDGKPVAVIVTIAMSFTLK